MTEQSAIELKAVYPSRLPFAVTKKGNETPEQDGVIRFMCHDPDKAWYDDEKQISVEIKRDPDGEYHVSVFYAKFVSINSL